MKKKCLILFCFFLSFGAYSQNIEPIMEGFYAKIGDVSEWRKVKSLRIVAESIASHYIMSDTATYTIYCKSPKKFYMKPVSKNPNRHRVANLSDGEKAWIIRDTRKAERSELMETAFSKEPYPFSVNILLGCRFADYRTLYEIQYEREETRNGILYDVCLIKHKKSNASISFFFNKETSLIDISERDGDVMFYKDYRDVNGLKIPFLQESYKDGLMYSQEKYISVEINPEIHDEVFTVEYHTKK